MSRNRKKSAIAESRLARIEKKCDRILAALAAGRRKPSRMMDEAIDRLRSAAAKVRRDCEIERERIAGRLLRW